MCQVDTGAYGSLLAPGRTDFTVCHPRTTSTYILHVVPITTHTHDGRKSIGKRNKEKKRNEDEGKKRQEGEKRKRKERREKTRQEEDARYEKEKKYQVVYLPDHIHFFKIIGKRQL